MYFLVCLLKIPSSPDLCLFLVKWQKEYVIAVFRGIDDLYSQDQTPSSARPTLEHSLGQSSRLLQKSCTLGLTHQMCTCIFTKTLPKAQRTRGLSSSCQSNLLRSYHKSYHKFKIQLHNLYKTSAAKC